MARQSELAEGNQVEAGQAVPNPVAGDSGQTRLVSGRRKGQFGCFLNVCTGSEAAFQMVEKLDHRDVHVA